MDNKKLVGIIVGVAMILAGVLWGLHDAGLF